MAASKYVYNSVMNRWLNLQDYSGGKDSPKDWTSSVWKEGYDDPTYMTFKVEFGDWGASILDRHVINAGVTSFAAYTNDYDALPIGLLNCPYEGCEDAASYWQDGANNDSSIFNNVNTYSAFRYLRSRNEDTRAEYLYYFVNGLFELQKETPFIFQKISGIDQLEKFDAKQGLRLKDAKITLTCYEGLNLKIRTLMELYRKAAWDDVYQRWILPDNMREFKMIIYIFERRTFQDVIPYEVTGSDSVTRTAMEMKYGDLNAHIPVKAYECCPCEFLIGDSQSWISDYGSGTENAAETSKIVIQVKNVKTYYKNGLLSDTLANSYASQGLISNEISSKIDNMMIYDLVETVERQQDYYDTANADIDSDISSTINNTTLNGVRALFLNKNIILENEDANKNMRSYVWGHVYSHTSNATEYNSGDVIDAMYSSMFELTYAGTQSDLQEFREFEVTMNDLEDYSTASITATLKYVSLMISGVLYGSSLQLYGLNAGAPYSVATMAPLPPMNALDYQLAYTTMRPIKNFKMEGEREVPKLNYNKLMDGRQIDDMQYSQMENPRTIPDQQYSLMEDPRDLDDMQYSQMEAPRNIPDLLYAQMEDPRDIPDAKYAQMEDPRNVPDQDMRPLGDPRNIPDMQYAEMEPERDLPDAKYAQMENPRSIPDQQYALMEDPRSIPDLKYSLMEDPRDIPNQLYANIEAARTLPKQQYAEMEATRKIPALKYSELLDPRKIPEQEYAKLQLAREIPGMQYATLEDVRDIPEEKLVSLKDAAYRAIPQFEINRLELLDTISKATHNEDMKLTELDASNKDKEDRAIAALRDNKTLMSLSEEMSKKDDEKTKIAKFAKMIALNTDDIKARYIDSIEAKKKTLISLTQQVVRELPEMDMYALEDDHREKTNMAMISLTDLDYIHKNIHLISTSEQEYRQLSFGALISLEDEMGRQVDETQKLVGLSTLAKDVDKEKEIRAMKLNNSTSRRLGNQNMKMISMKEENDKAGKKKSTIVY